MTSTFRPCISPAALILVLILAVPALARDRVAAPEPRPSADTSQAIDHVSAPPASGDLLPDQKDRPNVGSSNQDKIGGVSVVVAEAEIIDASDIDVAANGDFYAVSCNETASVLTVDVYRSTDGGATWNIWGTLDDTNGFWRQPRIVVAEGSVSRCYIIAQHQVLPSRQLKIFTAWSDLSASSADFASTATEVMGASGVDFDRPQLLIDDFVTAAFFMYVVAEGDEGVGSDIWFARSLDFGVTWETPYTIATINLADRGYLNPQISLGQGGRVHVAWNFDNGTTGLDDAIRTRSVPSWGDGGSAAWGSILALNSSANGIEEYRPIIAASWTSDQVVITEGRATDEGAYLSIHDPGVFVSDDAGASYAETIITDGLTDGLSQVLDLLEDPDHGIWIFAGNGGGFGNPALVVAPAYDPTDWTTKEEFQLLPDSNYLQRMDIVQDPTHSDHIAAVWHVAIYVAGWWDSSETHFDAEWRGDPGWPVPVPGFPVALYDEPMTDPCLADLDNDGDLEILCGFATSQVGAWHHDGTPVDGWPQGAGGALSPAPLAVGDLTGDGIPLIIVCRADGDVRAFHPDGSQAWHKYGLSDNPSYASIGAFGGPEPRQIIVFCGQNMGWYDSLGHRPYGASSINWGFTGQAEAPPAIGDVDGDGQAEAIFHLGSHVFARGMRSTGTYWSRNLSADVSGAPILTDFDSDGEVEIVVTTEDGLAYLLDDDGSDYPIPGWPYDTGAGVALTGAATASCFSGGSNDFVFAGADNHLYLVQKSGNSAPNFPVTTPAAIPLAPVLTPIDGDAADLFFTDMAGDLHAWNPKPIELPGWPQPITPGLALSPSVGDLDDDGILDAVWLTEDSIHACSLGRPVPVPGESWPMAFFNAQRTSCSNCEENLVSDVVEQEEATIIRFAAPHPNPVYDRTAFSFTLPQETEVELAVYDLRGRRVASLVRERLGQGHHVQAWTGRDDRGRTVASGHYVARLRVGGEVLSRKITLVR